MIRVCQQWFFLSLPPPPGLIRFAFENGVPVAPGVWSIRSQNKPPIAHIPAGPTDFLSNKQKKKKKGNETGMGWRKTTNKKAKSFPLTSQQYAARFPTSIIYSRCPTAVVTWLRASIPLDHQPLAAIAIPHPTISLVRRSCTRKIFTELHPNSFLEELGGLLNKKNQKPGISIRILKITFRDVFGLFFARNVDDDISTSGETIRILCADPPIRTVCCPIAHPNRKMGNYRA